MKKSLPCCARIAGRLVREESEQRRAARVAAHRRQKDLPLTPKMIADLEKSKVAVERVKQAMVDHEAEHANEAAA